jgi:farnesol kinase
LLGVHKAPLKLVILELGCCFTAPVSITFTHSVISTTVMATLAAGNVIQLDLMAAALTLAGPLAVLQLFDELAKRDLLEKMLSRKLVHILAGLVFMLPWPLFSMSPYAKYMAAFAIAANGLRMIGLGLGLLKNDALVKAISRDGDKR